MNIVREKEMVPPIDDLPVDVVSILGTEWWISYRHQNDLLRIESEVVVAHRRDIQT
jgi:hypothetical protein